MTDTDPTGPLETLLVMWLHEIESEPLELPDLTVDQAAATIEKARLRRKPWWVRAWRTLVGH